MDERTENRDPTEEFFMKEPIQNDPYFDVLMLGILFGMNANSEELSYMIKGLEEQLERSKTEE